MKINDTFSSVFLASFMTTSGIVVAATSPYLIETSSSDYPASFSQLLQQDDFVTSQGLVSLTAKQVQHKLQEPTDYQDYRSDLTNSNYQRCVNRLLDKHQVKIGPNQVEFRARLDLSPCAAEETRYLLQQDLVDMHLILACSDGNFSALAGKGIHQAFQVVGNDETFCAPGTMGWRMGRSEAIRRYTQQTDLGTVVVQTQTIVVDSMPDGTPCKTQQENQYVAYQDGCQTFTKTSYQQATLNGVPLENQGRQDVTIKTSHGIRALKGKHTWFDSGHFDVRLNNQWQGQVVYSGAEVPPQYQMQSQDNQSVSGVTSQAADK